MKTIEIAAFAAFLGSAAAFAQTPAQPTDDPLVWDLPEFSTLDVNGDGQVSKDEARANAQLSANFSAVDADNNGSLSASEYVRAKGRSPGTTERTYPPTEPIDPTRPDQL